MTDSLTAPGSSTYDSNTMYVGDGTWDSTKNTFLLPNLVGLNFATMRYNGMGNRFSSLPEYHRLIVGHGVVGAICFLGLVPAAIFFARFYHRNPRLALRLHIWLQILLVFLLTVVFILGFIAVGPERSLTNPHHGIGVAIYTLVWVQFLGGALIHRIEKGKQRWRIPVKLMLHQWFGRAIALLGIVQVPLGLTLYGSPKYLFILYSLFVFALLLLYFILTHRYQSAADINGYDYDSSYVTDPSRSWITGDQRTNRSDGNALRNTALLGGGLAALAALRRKPRERGRGVEVSDVDRSRLGGSRRGSQSSVVYTEKDVERPIRERNTWRDRILGAGVGLGAYEGLKRLFDRRKKQDEESSFTTYQRPAYVEPQVYRADIANVQEGGVPFSPDDPRARGAGDHVDPSMLASPTRQPLHPRPSGEVFSSDDEQESYANTASQPPVGKTHGFKDGVATLGLLGLIREKQRQRREKKERQRIDALRLQDEENASRINRANSRRYGTRPEAERYSSDEDVFTGSNPELSRRHLPASTGPPLPSSVEVQQQITTDPGYPNPHGPPPIGPAYPVAEGAVPMPTGPVEPDPSRLVHSTTSSIPGPDRRPRNRISRRNSASQATVSDIPESVASPPVSVKVQMHKDGRHVTLRRLNEHEAAAERDARRSDRRRRRRAESLSSGVEDGSTRFRRNGNVQPSATAPITNVPPPPGSTYVDELNLPPPVPAHSATSQGMGMSPSQALGSGMTSGVGSPGTYDTAEGTDLSAFDSNRRRRRAERASARARAAQQGSRVEFS